MPNRSAALFLPPWVYRKAILINVDSNRRPKAYITSGRPTVNICAASVSSNRTQFAVLCAAAEPSAGAAGMSTRGPVMHAPLVSTVGTVNTLLEPAADVTDEPSNGG